MESSKPKPKLKLMVDMVGRTVLFAEAGKDVVDFLFSILELPLCDVVRVLTKESTVGCLGKLYGSVESLDDTYVQDNQRKRYLLTPPKVASPASSSNAAVIWKEDSAPYTYYRCADSNIYSTAGSHYVRYGCGYFSDHACVTCPCCNTTMSTQMKYVFPPGFGKAAASSGGTGGEKGFVKGAVTYMVMDDLSVAPTSAFSGIALFNKFEGKDVGSWEETTVELGTTEALALLKASLTSTTVLTDVFLRKK